MKILIVTIFSLMMGFSSLVFAGYTFTIENSTSKVVTLQILQKTHGQIYLKPATSDQTRTEMHTRVLWSIPPGQTLTFHALQEGGALDVSFSLNFFMAKDKQTYSCVFTAAMYNLDPEAKGSSKYCTDFLTSTDKSITILSAEIKK